MIEPIVKLRFWAQNVGIQHWQYLLIALIIAVIGSVGWFYIAVFSGYELGFISAIPAFLLAILSYACMSEQGEARKVFFSIFFSFLAFFIGKYLLFEHYHDWYISAYIDKSVINLDLLIFYFTAFNFESLKLSVSSFPILFSMLDIVWILAIILLNLIFLILPFEPVPPKKEAFNRFLFKKRRFD
jgi:hypothetical protein